MRITPIQTMILLHYSIFVEEWLNNDHQLAKLVNLNLLARETDSTNVPQYVITDRGKAYVASIQRTEIPELKWVASDQTVIRRTDEYGQS